MMQPAIQKQVVESLSASANVGNRDSALYLATIHLSVRYKPEEAMRWLSRAAELGSSTAAYLYYRLHEATGVEMEKDRLMVSQWLYQGSAWGSWIAFDDFIEFEDWAENIAKTILMWQGSFNGDIPFREEALTGRFTIQPVGTRLELLDREIAAAGGHVHDIILAGRESNRLLHWAAGIGSSEVVAHLIDKHGASVNCLNRNGETPLLAACRAGNGRGVVELMMRGADKSIVSHSRQTPLHWLWTFEKSARHMRDSEKLAVLTDLGRVLSTGQVNATADAVTERINGFKDEQSVHRLQSHLLSDLPLGTPLHWAVQRRCLLTVQALLKIGANPFVPVLVGNHRWGGSAAHLAAAMHDDDIFQLFVDSVAPEPERHRTIFEDASELFPGFLDTVISGRATRTHANGRFERMGRHGAMYRDRTRRMLRLLVDNGVTKLQGQYKMEGSIVPTPLFLAVMHGQTDIAEAMLEIPEFQADLEVACGLYTSAMETPLLKSVSFCNADMYFLLRSHGANTNVTTHGQATTIGDSALSLCAYVGHEQMDVALDLIKSGNPVNSGCSNLMSPIFWAALGAHFHLAELLLTHGAEINELQDWRTKKLMTLSLDEPTTVLGLLLRTCSISTALPLQWLFESHDAGKFTLDPIICPSTGATVFHAVAAVDEAGRDEEVLRDALLHIMSRFAGQSDLVNAYAYHAPDSASRHGTTPLIDAVRRSNLTVAKALVNAGADIFKTCTDGYQPLQYAKSMLFKFESLDVSVYSPKTLSSMEKSRDEMLKLLSPTDTSST
jgi:ankyrin repeat protein